MVIFVCDPQLDFYFKGVCLLNPSAVFIQIYVHKSGNTIIRDFIGDFEMFFSFFYQRPGIRVAGKARLM